MVPIHLHSIKWQDTTFCAAVKADEGQGELFGMRHRVLSSSREKRRGASHQAFLTDDLPALVSEEDSSTYFVLLAIVGATLTAAAATCFSAVGGHPGA